MSNHGAQACRKLAARLCEHQEDRSFMSIQPISDIILDVANAADPVKVAAMKQKLADAAGGDFAAVLLGGSGSGTVRSGAAGWSEEAKSQFFSAPTGARIVDKSASADEAKRGLETLV